MGHLNLDCDLLEFDYQRFDSTYGLRLQDTESRRNTGDHRDYKES